jgi:phosphate transport system protein
MPRESYQERLDELREDVLYMSEVVIERLRKALSALEHKDEAAAREVIEGDHEINELYLQLENDCVDLLALQQPVASDLRFITASFKIITDLERVGDLATNLGEYTERAEQDVFPDVDVQTVGEAVAEMVADAMAAYADEDVDAAYAIADRDDEVDAMCEAASETVVRDLITREVDTANPETEVEATMTEVRRLLLTIRDLERVGDHAVNVAARTVYMVDNDDDLIY